MFYDGLSWCENRCPIENDRFNETVEKGRERTKGKFGFVNRAFHGIHGTHRLLFQFSTGLGE